MFLSDVATLFCGRVVVFIRPPSVCRNFLWLVAALFPGLSLLFASGLSSPGLICCYAMSLRYVTLLSSGCAPTVCLATGFVAFFPVLSFLLALVVQAPVGSLLPYGSQLSRWGHPCGVEASLLLDRNKGLVCFSFPFGLFFVLPLSFGMWSPYVSSVLVGSHLCATYGCP